MPEPGLFLLKRLTCRIFGIIFLGFRYSSELLQDTLSTDVVLMPSVVKLKWRPIFALPLSVNADLEMSA
jgi:hypothetical protein